MKHRHRNRIFPSPFICFAASAAVGLLPSQLIAGEPAEPETPPAAEPTSNWVTFTLGGVAMDGDEAAFQRAAGQDGDIYGGLSSLHWALEQDDLSYSLDGHALFGNEDYDLTLNVSKTDLGYLRAGYRGFRTWYDGSGGFVPGVAGGWLPLYDDELHVDRGEVWLEAGLQLEKLPEILFRYGHSWRRGDKDSTSWGRTTPGYGIAPSLISLDERKDSFGLEVSHTLGNTKLGLSLLYENGTNDDFRLMQSNPGDPSPTADRDITQHELTEYDLFSASIFSETRFTDQVLGSFGYNFFKLDTDTRGERTSIDRNGTVTASDHAYSALVGGGDFSLNTLSGALHWTPTTELTFTAAARAEWEDSDALASFIEGAPQVESSDGESDLLNEEFEVRYTGLEDVVIYARAEFEQEDANAIFRETGGDLRAKSADIDQQKYSLGANYYPAPGLSLSAQYFVRFHDVDYGNTFNPLAANALDAQLAGYSADTDDVNFRLTWQARPELTFVTRYDYQQSDYTDQGINAAGTALASVDGGEVTRSILSQSVTWLPFQRAYLRGMINFIWADTDTPANGQVPYRIADSSNDSISANLAAGYVLDDKTDLQFGYTYFYARNLAQPRDASGAPGSVPYGTDLEEHLFSLTLLRKVSENLLWNMGYGFYTSNDGTSGGNNDFNAHLISTGLQLRF
jgi:hypothetical protein